MELGIDQLVSSMLHTLGTIFCTVTHKKGSFLLESEALLVEPKTNSSDQNAERFDPACNENRDFSDRNMENLKRNQLQQGLTYH